MSGSPERSGDERIVSTAAVVSGVLGSILLIAPAGAGRAIGVDAGNRVLRMIGVVDLALGAGLLSGRPTWPWLVARAASNPLIAAVAVTYARSLRARVLAAGLIGATIIDLRTAARMRSSVVDDASSVGLLANSADTG
jgi:hypothetical protein